MPFTKEKAIMRMPLDKAAAALTETSSVAGYRYGFWSRYWLIFPTMG